MPTERPAASVILPFYGDASEASEMLDRVSAIALRADDETIVVDNSPEGAACALATPPGVRVMRSPVTGSAYAARNVGIEAARADWLLLIDADCRPPADLIDRYLIPAPGARVGALAGEVAGAPEQSGFVPRYIRSRGHLSPAGSWHHPHGPMAVTANLMVRRAAWAAVGGFQECTRSGADAEFCWRLQDAGWSLEQRPEAALVHLHRESVGALLRQAARDGAGQAWVERIRPGSGTRPRLTRELARAAAGVLVWGLTGRAQRAAFKALDAIWVVATNAGYLCGNGPADARGSAATGAVAVFVRYPAADDAGEVAKLTGQAARVEAAGRPERPDWRTGRALPVAFSEDDGIARSAIDAARVALRHPRRVASDHRTRGPDDEPLRRIASAVRRIAAAGAERVSAGPSAQDAARAERLRRLAGS